MRPLQTNPRRPQIDAYLRGDPPMTAIDRLSETILYEGYLLYPYRLSALKNQRRWLFGCVFPEAYAKAHGTEAWTLQTECLAHAAGTAALQVRIRFLQLTDAGTVEREFAPPEQQLDHLIHQPQRTP